MSIYEHNPVHSVFKINWFCGNSVRIDRESPLLFKTCVDIVNFPNGVFPLLAIRTKGKSCNVEILLRCKFCPLVGNYKVCLPGVVASAKLHKLSSNQFAVIPWFFRETPVSSTIVYQEQVHLDLSICCSKCYVDRCAPRLSQPQQLRENEDVRAREIRLAESAAEILCCYGDGSSEDKAKRNDHISAETDREGDGTETIQVRQDSSCSD